MATGSVGQVVRGCSKRSSVWSSAWLRRTGAGATAESRELLPIWAMKWRAAPSPNLLKEHGLEPAPERERKTTWREFLSRHREVIVAADFFTIEAWTRKGLTRFLVLFLIDLSSRRVQIAGVTRDGKGLGMSQVARNLGDAAEGFLIGKRYLIHDRDPLFTAEFLEILEATGVQSVKLPARSPNLKACTSYCTLS